MKSLPIINNSNLNSEFEISPQLETSNRILFEVLSIKNLDIDFFKKIDTGISVLKESSNDILESILYVIDDTLQDIKKIIDKQLKYIMKFRKEDTKRQKKIDKKSQAIQEGSFDPNEIIDVSNIENLTDITNVLEEPNTYVGVILNKIHANTSRASETLDKILDKLINIFSSKIVENISSINNTSKENLQETKKQINIEEKNLQETKKQINIEEKNLQETKKNKIVEEENKRENERQKKESKIVNNQLITNNNKIFDVFDSMKKDLKTLSDASWWDKLIFAALLPYKSLIGIPKSIFDTPFNFLSGFVEGRKIAIENMLKTIKIIFEEIRFIVKGYFDLFFKKPIKFLNSIINKFFNIDFLNSIKTFFSTIKKPFDILEKETKTFSSNLLNLRKYFSFIKKPFDIIKNIFISFVKIGNRFIKTLQFIKNGVVNIVKMFFAPLEHVIKYLGIFAKYIKSSISNIMKGGSALTKLSFFQSLMKTFSFLGKISGIVNVILASVMGTYNLIMGTIDTFKNTEGSFLKKMLFGIYGGIKKGLQSVIYWLYTVVIETISDLFSWLTENIYNSFSWILQKITGIDIGKIEGLDIFKMVQNFIQDVILSIAGFMEDYFGKTVSNLVKKLLGWSSDVLLDTDIVKYERNKKIEDNIEDIQIEDKRTEKAMGYEKFSPEENEKNANWVQKIFEEENIKSKKKREESVDKFLSKSSEDIKKEVEQLEKIEIEKINEASKNLKSGEMIFQSDDGETIKTSDKNEIDKNIKKIEDVSNTNLQNKINNLEKINETNVSMNKSQSNNVNNKNMIAGNEIKNSSTPFVMQNNNYNSTNVLSQPISPENNDSTLKYLMLGSSFAN